MSLTLEEKEKLLQKLALRESLLEEKQKKIFLHDDLSRLKADGEKIKLLELELAELEVKIHMLKISDEDFENANAFKSKIFPEKPNISYFTLLKVIIDISAEIKNSILNYVWPDSEKSCAELSVSESEAINNSLDNINTNSNTMMQNAAKNALGDFEIPSSGKLGTEMNSALEKVLGKFIKEIQKNELQDIGKIEDSTYRNNPGI